MTNESIFSLTKIQKKIYIAFMALQYFAFNNWTFINDKFMSLNEKILKDDVDSFYFYHEHVDMQEYYRNALIGGAKYLLKTDTNDVNMKIRQRRLKYLHYFVVYGFYFIVGSIAWNILLSFFSETVF